MELLNNSSEDKLLESLQNIENIVKKNLYFNHKIRKLELIQIARKKQKKYPEKWKKLKKKFGKILKLLKTREREIKYWNDYYENKENDYGYLLYYDNNIITRLYNNIKVKKISTIFNNNYNQSSFIILSNDNKLYAKGLNSFQQLGIKDQNFITELKEIKNDNLKYCIDVKMGWSHTIFNCKKKIYGCGCGISGRLGNNLTKNINPISELIITEKINKIECGSTNTYFLTENGEIFSCGNKKYVGFESDEDILIPKKINIDSKYKFIDISVGMGSYHIIALNNNGEVYSWGHNRVGQTSFYPKNRLNLNFNPIIILPKKIDIDFLVYKISGGWGHSGILDFEGSLYLFGRNCSGQLGLKKEESNQIVNIINNNFTYYSNRIKKLNFKNKIVDFYCGTLCTIFKIVNNNGNELIYKIGSINKNNFNYHPQLIFNNFMYEGKINIKGNNIFLIN
jgi:alpha-tubulin suppressor-like RCC1 family protein